MDVSCFFSLRQSHGKGAPSDFALHGNLAVIVLYDLVSEPQAQPRASPAGFVVKRGRKTLPTFSGAMPQPEVRDPDRDRAVFPLPSYAQVSAVFHGMHGVNEEVEHHLLKIMYVELDPEPGGTSLRTRHSPFFILYSIKE